MKHLFSGNSDLIAVVAIVLTVGLGSAINIDSAIIRETRDHVITRTRMAAFERELMEAEREIRRTEKIFRTIACERR
jgi:hypothetical protein